MKYFLFTGLSVIVLACNFTPKDDKGMHVMSVKKTLTLPAVHSKDSINPKPAHTLIPLKKFGR